VFFLLEPRPEYIRNIAHWTLTSINLIELVQCIN